ncbi:MAG TPA: phosphatase PAP2 family protein [Candidatus Sulfomarinibacteraceae bacterium]|nr:phosphatase PAP2 family protein [Candidatus Sulfomarinibacteraceae bacterium]
MQDSAPEREQTTWNRLTAFYRRMARLELRVLFMLALVLGGLWAFFAIADVAVEEESHPLDTRLLLAMRNPEDSSDPLGPPWFEEMMRDITALGGTGVVAFITLSTVGYLLIRRDYSTALLIIVAIAGAYALSIGLKISFDRPRPDLVPRSTAVFNPSYPSGHSMLSAAAYLTLGAVLARVQAWRRLKIYILSLAIVLTLAIGISRVYLGVHWPTDVLGGWAAGSVWAMLVWIVARWQRSRTRQPATGRRSRSTYRDAA